MRHGLPDHAPDPGYRRALWVALGLNALMFGAELVFGFKRLLYTHYMGDAQARSVWLCSRNDAPGNLGVILATSGV